MEHVPTKEDLIAAAKRLSVRIPRTPILRADALDHAARAELHFKMESLMPGAGCFKLRGAMNALLSLTPEERARGVVTMSSGNHAQATALVAQKMGIKASIVMPKNSNPLKMRNVRESGGRIIECEPGDAAREEKLREVQKETNGVLIHPFNDYRVIAGQATAAKELLEDVPDLDVIVAPVGGGGLLSGTLLAAHYFSPRTKVIAGEPAGADDAYRSLQAGSIQKNETVRTIADGLITTLGDKTFDIIRQHMQAEDIIRVDDAEISDAMRQLWERLRAVVEPSGAVPYAAVLKNRERFYRKKVGIIVSGGNADLDRIPFLSQK